MYLFNLRVILYEFFEKTEYLIFVNRERNERKTKKVSDREFFEKMNLKINRKINLITEIELI